MKRDITIEDCPICGHTLESVRKNRRGQWVVECIWCGNHGRPHKTKRGAIKAWNKGEVWETDPTPCPDCEEAGQC